MKIEDITDTTPIVGAPFGKVTVTISGTWNGAVVTVEQQIDRNAGGPHWTTLPRPEKPLIAAHAGFYGRSENALVPEFRQPFTADETRVMYLFGGSIWLRIAKGRAAPRLTLEIGDATPDEAVPPPEPPPPYFMRPQILQKTRAQYAAEKAERLSRMPHATEEA